MSGPESAGGREPICGWESTSPLEGSELETTGGRGVTVEMAVVLAVIAAALVLFVTERFPVEQVALAIPVVLLVSGILSPEEAISGFSNAATVTVAAMLVLSLGLVKTGAVEIIGRWAQSAPLGGPRTRLFVLCGVVAAISPFLNNTPIVVIFIPVFLAVADQAGEPPSRYLIPLSFAAILGGTITLIGTSTNLIVYGMARNRGLDDLSMFSIAPLGLVYVAVGLTYLFTIGRSLLPTRERPADLESRYDVRRFVTELEVTPDSPAAERALEDLRWPARFDVSVLAVGRGGRTTWNPRASRRLRPGDLLWVQGDSDDILKLADEEGLVTLVERVEEDLAAAGSAETAVGDEEERRIAEVLVGPGSAVVGRTLKETRFFQRYGASVMAIQHLGAIKRGRVAEVRVEPGDILLVHGRPTALDSLVGEPGLVPLGERGGPYVPRPRALVAISILAGVVAFAGLEIVPILSAALVGVILMLFTRCVALDELYEELDWMIVFLLAGVIPLGIAMDKTGAAEWMGHWIGETFGTFGPVVMVAAFYLACSVLTEVMSNNAAAVVLTPIAIQTAADVGMNPYALLVAVMFGASASFMTPVGYQTNTLVYGAGGYRFGDFFKVGAPLNLILLITATLLIPVFWPS